LANLFNRIVRSTASTEKRAIDASVFNLGLPDQTTTSAGVNVSVTSGYQLAAVWACVNLITDAVAMLPVHAFKKQDNFRVQVDPQPKWIDKNNYQPNPDATYYEFISGVMNSLLLRGNAYLMISKRNQLGFPEEMVLLHPDDVNVQRKNGKVTYEIKGDLHFSYLNSADGDIVHIKGYSQPSSLVGLSPIEQLKETIGLTAATEKFGGNFFKNNSVTNAIIELDNQPTEEQIKVFADTWKRNHNSSQGKAFTPAILSGGAKFKSINIPNDQAQFLETRKFQVAEIARIYRVPPHLLADVERSTSWGSGLEEQNRAFLQYSILPYLTRIEGVFNRLLPRGQFIKFDTSAYLRGDLQTRYEAYSKARMNGFMTANEIRSLEDMPPLPSDIGDVILQPLNYIDASKNGEVNE